MDSFPVPTSLLAVAAPHGKIRLRPTCHSNEERARCSSRKANEEVSSLEVAVAQDRQKKAWEHEEHGAPCNLFCSVLLFYVCVALSTFGERPEMMVLPLGFG